MTGGEPGRTRRRAARTWRLDQVAVLLIVSAACAAITAALLLAAPAAGSRVLPPPTHSATPAGPPSPALDTLHQPENIDVLRAAIRTYYGDPNGTGRFGLRSPYARDTEAVARAGSAWLAQRRTERGRRAVVFDIDDTLLSAWSYDTSTDWVSTSAGSRAWVLGQHGPAVPGMLALVRAAAREGYAVIYLTGRSTSERAATLGNLGHDDVGVDAGYPAPARLSDGESGLFLRPAPSAYPGYLRSACAADPDGHCTTQHFKTAVRAHVESLGYRIVASFGDQPTDLAGGHAERTFLLPNPNYRSAG